MKLLLIYGDDILSRHELGFVASLLYNNVTTKIIHLTSSKRFQVEKLLIRSDYGTVQTDVVTVPYKGNILSFSAVVKVLREYIDVTDFDAIISTPRHPWMVGKCFSSALNVPVILRVWSVRAFKVIDNIKHGVYSDLFLFIPSFASNVYEILSSNMSMFTDNYTFTSMRKFISRRAMVKVYPPYGSLISNHKDESDEAVLSAIDKYDEYVLGFTVLNKRGVYLKFEAKPHAFLFYKLARENPGLTFIVAGSSLNDFKRAFPWLAMKKPSNLVFLGKGFSDGILPDLYKKAYLVVHYVSNKSISNRFLESAFFKKAVVINELITTLHPELRHGNHIHIVNSLSGYYDAIKYLIRHPEYVGRLSFGIWEAYTKYFSTRINYAAVKCAVKCLSETWQ